MDCPTCRIAHSRSSHEGVAVRQCVTCGGQFLEFEALRLVLTSEGCPRTDAERSTAMAMSETASTAPLDARPPLACPSCGTSMRRYVHQYSSGVWLDACEAHGVWLDDGELDRLEAFAEANRRGMLAPPLRQPEPRPPVGTATPRIATTPGPYDHLGDDVDGHGTTLVGVLELLGVPGAAESSWLVEPLAIVGAALLQECSRQRGEDARAKALLDQARRHAGLD